MSDCPICENNPDRLAERIAHEVLDWIAEKEGYERIIHTKPNSLRDRQGKDFVVVPKGSRVGLFIQIKAFRILKNRILKPKLQRLRGGMKLKKGRPEKIDTLEELRNFILKIFKEFQKVELSANDSEFLAHFRKLAKNLKLEKVLASGKDYDELFSIYGKLEAYFNLMEKEIRHAKLYPDVKVFLLVNTTEWTITRAQIEKLKKEWLPIIRETMNNLKE